MRRKTVNGWHVLLAVGMTLPGLVAAATAPLPKTQVEQAVIAAIPPWHSQKATILKYLDLTRPFDTASPWALVVAQDPHQQAGSMPDDEENPVVVCLVERLAPHCTEALSGLPTFHSSKVIACEYGPCYERAYGLLEAQVVFAAAHSRRPMLLLKTRSMRAPNGSALVQTVLYRYDMPANRFRAVFVNGEGTNNNQAAHYVAHGPLQGDEIVDFPTGHPPYVYWIEVYAPGKSGRYTRILLYRSSTHYADGNPLPVADSEMPAIMERLGLWKPGDALPVPQPLPANCGRLVMNRGEEWCRNLCVNYGGNACSRFTKAKQSAIRDR